MPSFSFGIGGRSAVKIEEIKEILRRIDEFISIEVGDTIANHTETLKIYGVSNAINRQEKSILAMRNDELVSIDRDEYAIDNWIKTPEKITKTMTLELPIEEYFKYHPPTTPKRIALHERVNRESLEICKALIEEEQHCTWLCFRDAAILLAIDVCHDETCLTWAKSAIERTIGAYSISNIDTRSTAILMNIQQFRMFLNQGITVVDILPSLKAWGFLNIAI